MKEKIRFQMRISPETDQRVKAAIPLSNCRSQNEFVEQALNHYCACLQAQDSSSILAPALVNAVRAAVQNSENHISRLLFKLAVEVDKISLEICIKAPFRGHEDIYEKGEQVESYLSMDFDYDRLLPVLLEEFYEEGEEPECGYGCTPGCPTTMTAG